MVRFIETIFHLPSLQSRDPSPQDGPETSDRTEAFDWTQVEDPPLVLQTRGCLGKR